MDTLKERIAVIVDSECGGNKSDFARRVGIAPAYAAQIYAGVRSPSPRLIADICREFSINPDWLACGAGPMRQQVSREEELAAFFGELSRDPDGSVRKRFIAALAKLPLESWDAIDAFCRDVYGIDPLCADGEDLDK